MTSAPSPPHRTEARRARVVIHMGDAKTGTTTFQGKVFAFREHLKGQGVAYAESGKTVPKAIGHHLLPRSLYESPAGTPLETLAPWAELRAEIDALAPDHRLLISSEGFSSLYTADQAERVGAFFAECDVRFCLVVRDPVDWIESFYAQMVKAPPFTSTSFSDFRKWIPLKGPVAACQLAEVFKPEAFDILTYRPTIVEDLAHCLMLAFPETDAAHPGGAAQRQNVALPDDVISVYLMLNQIKIPDRERTVLYRDLARQIEQVRTEPPGPGGLLPVRMSPSERAAYRDYIQPTIMRFAETFDFTLPSSNDKN